MTSSHTQVTWKPEAQSDGNTSATTGEHVLVRFAVAYSAYHGYISVVVCVIGITCSLLVIAVLTRRHMLTSSNYMLTALAICDTITMLSYIPYAIQFYCLYGIDPTVERNTLAWIRFCLVHANLSVTSHTASIWITVALSAFRYSIVRRATDGRAVTAVSAGNDIRRSRYIILPVSYTHLTLPTKRIV